MGALINFGVPFFLPNFLRGDFYGGFLWGGWCPPAPARARPRPSDQAGLTKIV